MAKLLLVEDDRSISFVVQTCLEVDNHLVDAVETGQQALAALLTHEYDLILLDWNLPDISGLEVCQRHRSRGGTTPILLLTAKGGADDKVTALDAGADDYVAKPFVPEELLARIRAILRRPKAIVPTNLSIGEIELDPSKQQLKIGEHTVELAPMEFALLELLMRHPNKSFTPEAIIHRLWQSDTSSSNDTVRTHIKNLRRKLGDAEGSIIKSKRGLGYSFDSDGSSKP